MARTWTKEQSDAIYADGGSVLVSAAAGSGKTSVLVERVINMITREENPIDVDRLLIVTFTRKAAEEMRQRISKALSDLLANDPYNPVYLKQKQLLYNASISTIDSFCSDLVRDYFHTLGISRDFRLDEGKESDLISPDAMNDTFEYFYEAEPKRFVELVDAFSDKQGDEKLRKVVLKLCTFLSTQPFPDKWLTDMLGNYSVDSFSKTMWCRTILNYCKSMIPYAYSLINDSLNMLENEPKFEKNYELIMNDKAFFDSLLDFIFDGKWNKVSIHLDSFVAGRLSTPKGYSDHPVKKAVEENRSLMKELIKEMKSYFAWSDEEATADVIETRPYIEMLFEVVREYLKRFEKMKEARNILTFSDVELLTVKLLAEPTDDGYRKTPQALELSQRYDAVIVDEFQDVNDVQDLIFKCISRDEKNLFAVGDVKQSIYSFRQAKPEIFISKKEAYNRYNGDDTVYPATIILDKNFRSRFEVCDTVNFIFENLMTEESSQMDYTEDEKLNVGASYPEGKNCETELVLLEEVDGEKEESIEAEARYIAEKIYAMISDGYEVFDGDKMRKAEYSDFAVLVRSPKNSAHIYVNTLMSYGIPVTTDKKENALASSEIKVMLNLLRVIDNPTLDIPLLSVMCSPIYGFTPDELADIRSQQKHTNLYSAVKACADTDSKARFFLSELEYYRTYAVTTTVDDLLGKIYDRTAFLSIAVAAEKSSTPEKNLWLLREYARKFEANGAKSLSDFVSYVDKLIENGTSLEVTSGSDGDALNCVSVLSIHASKGLEYPVCFLANTGKQFYMRDLFENVLVDSRAGIGIKKKSGKFYCDTLPRLAVKLEMEKNKKAEELRILYVALTRAKEKLIVLSTVKKRYDFLSKIYAKLDFGQRINSYSVVKSRSIAEWIYLCAMVHPKLFYIRALASDESTPVPYDENRTQWLFSMPDNDSTELLDISDTEAECDTEDYKASVVPYADILRENLSSVYKNEKIKNLPQKVSASQIAHEQSNSYFEQILQKPSFLTEETTQAVDRGTAHHKFLQYCDFKRAREDFDTELQRLADLGVLSEKDTQLIDRENLIRLLDNELFARIIASEKIYREERFFVRISPSVVFDEYSEVKTDATVIVQGAVDLAFVENGKLVIVDYKTDRVRELNRLKELYSRQLLIYKEALSQTLELEVGECIICSVHLNDCISIDK